MSLKTYIINGERIAARSDSQAMFAYRKIQEMLRKKLSHAPITSKQIELDL